MSLTVGLLIIALCVLLEGFFSGSEIALVSADKVTIRSLRKQGTLTGQRLGRFLDDPEAILTTTLIGTNLSVVTATTVFAVLLRQHWHREGELLTVAILSPILLLFGELLPKSAYSFHATRVAQAVIHPLSVLSTVLGPLIVVVRMVTRRLERLMGREVSTGGVSREELRLLLEHRESEEIEEVERDMIDRIFEFGEVTAREVMRPLIDVVAVEQGDPMDDTVAKLRETGYSRLPVFAERVDDIVGVLWAADVLFLASLEEGRPGDIARPVHYVPENQKVAELLTDSRLKRSGLAVVVDEYGGAMGIVTVEDILEEIVGEIEDEHDDPEDDIQQRGEREFRVSARIEVDRLNEALEIELPEGTYETLAGYLLHRFGRIPRVGEAVAIGGATLTIAGCSTRAIDEVDIVVPARPDPGADEVPPVGPAI